MATNGKKRMKKTQAYLLSAALLTGTFACHTSALGATPATARLSPQYRIVVDNVEQTFYSASGSEMHPLVYNGSTYLPLRAIGELMGKNVNWDQTTQTVSIAGVQTTSPTKGILDTWTKAQSVSVQVCPEFTIMVEGVKRSFTDAGGNTAFPLLYNGSTYLPLRAIGELMGKNVTWDNDTKTASLSGMTGIQVTDADSFVTSPAEGNTAAGVITAETAKSRALAHAGLTGSQVTFTEQKLTRDDDRQIYKVEFFSGSAEYEYEIDAITGNVLEFDYSGHHGTAPSKAGALIGEAKAREIALAKVPGATASNVVKLELDRDFNEAKYEIKIYSGNTEYEFEIDAYSGVILEWASETHR